MKILVIGESCTDKFVYGDVKRLSPEAPVPVINPVEVISNKGMAGNTVMNLKALDNKAKVDLWTQEEEIIKTRFVEKKSNHMFIRFDEGEENISGFDKYDLRDLGTYDIVVVSDYCKGLLSDIDIEEIGNRSRITILDTKRKLTSKMVKCYSFIKLNEFEKANNKALKHKGIITTLGSRGAEYRGQLFPSPRPQETIDVSGAGDTFTAAFTLKYFYTENVSLAIEYANNKASEVVVKRGVAIPSVETNKVLSL